MTWLIRLYPPAWRRRYGRELAELLAAQPASFRTAVDLVAGAVDAWLNPQLSTAVTAASAKGAGAMVPKMLKLRSAGYGANVATGCLEQHPVYCFSDSIGCSSGCLLTRPDSSS